jgi:non-heme chloroperoxidase
LNSREKTSSNNATREEKRRATFTVVDEMHNFRIADKYVRFGRKRPEFIYSQQMPTAKRLRECLALTSAAFLLVFVLAKANAAEWRDPSKHTVRFVEVEPGVKLEVLDWGGSGAAVLLLAGHGDTGHIFDDFAPCLIARFHVFALTRRGFGASSQPRQGYDLATLVNDISQVVDTLRLKRVHLVGHSIAGDEMTRFALTFPDKVGKIVYLDAAYDRVEAQQLEATFPKLPPQREPALGSPESVRAFVERTEILMPEAEIRATRVFGSSGRYVRPVTPDWILTAVARIVEHPSYKLVRAPMLAIYSVYTDPAQLALRYNTADPEVRHGIEQIFDMWQKFAKAQRNDFRQSAPNVRVVEIKGASHYLFISRQARVLEELRAFLQAP